MKRFLVVLAAAMLCCSLAKGQEAEDSGRGAGLSIIPRIDAGVLYDGENETTSFTYGNTSLYTLFEGNISDDWSFSVCNHWVASDYSLGGRPADAVFGPTKDLYHLNLPGGIGSSVAANAYNFLDWAYITWAPGPFEFTLGKQVLLMGGFEYDDYDFDVNPLMASWLWNTYNCYQWGLTAAYNIGEIGTVSLQGAFNARNTGLSVALGWSGEYGPYSMKWSVLANPNYNYADAPWNVLVSLGNRLTFGGLSITADYFNAVGDRNYFAEGYQMLYPSLYGHTVVGSIQYDLEDSWDFGVKGVMNIADKDHPYGYCNANKAIEIPAGYVTDPDEYYPFDELSTVSAGLWASWYPLGDKSLRVQASGGVSSIREGSGYAYAMLGLTYCFDIKLW